MIRGARLSALAVALLALAPPCRASLFDTYGHGARGTAMGGAMVKLNRASIRPRKR